MPMRDVATLRYRGLMPEKIIARALSEGIRIDSVKYVSAREMLLTLPEGDAEKLMQMAERFSLDFVWLRHSPSGKLKKTVRRRFTLIPALILCIAMLVWFSDRVWMIEVRTDSEARQDAEHILLNALYDLGVRAGVRKRAIDTDALSTHILAKSDQFSFVGIRLTGVRLLVEAVGELPAPDLYEIDGARDLVASEDAVIARVNPRAGTAAVSPGDTVLKGQALIRGEEKLTDELTHGVCALGEVYARCWRVGEAEALIYTVKREYTGRSSLSSELRFMDYAYPLLTGPAYESQETTVQRLPIGGLFLPIHIVTTQNRETREVKADGDLEAIRAKISEIALQNAEELLDDGCVVIDKWIDYSMIEGDMIRARAVIEVERNIAVSRSALRGGGN